MRVAILTVGSRGDVQPFIGLARQIGRIGHPVTIVSHEPFRRLVTGHGVAFRPLDGDPRAVVASDEGQQLLRTRNPLRLTRRFVELLSPHWDRFVEDALAATADADLLVYSPLAFIGFHLAEARHQRSAFVAFQPLVPTSAFPVVPLGGRSFGSIGNRMSHQAVNRIAWRLMRPMVDVLRTSLDLPPEPRGGPYERLDERREPFLLAYSRHIGPVGHDWRAGIHVTGAWSAPSPPGWFPDPDLEAFLADGPAPVYAGLGSMQDRDSEARAEAIISGCRVTDRRLIIQTGWGGLSSLGDDRVHVLDDAEHGWLFPQCSAIVHHGGAGTTHSSAAAGRPSVIIPFFADQPFWAHHLRRVGAGVGPVPRRGLTTATMASAIEQASQDRVMAGAARLRESMAEEGGISTATRVLQLSDR